MLNIVMCSNWNFNISMTTPKQTLREANHPRANRFTTNRGVLSTKAKMAKKPTWQTKGSESDQVGWLRNECAYSPNTLIGNWNENRFDVSLLSQAKPLPSQHNHYFETTYTQSFSKEQPTVPEALKFSRGKREMCAFPAHQPVLDPPQIKQMYDSFLTSSMAAYGGGSRDATKTETHNY